MYCTTVYYLLVALLNIGGMETLRLWNQQWVNAKAFAVTRLNCKINCDDSSNVTDKLWDKVNISVLLNTQYGTWLFISSLVAALSTFYTLPCATCTNVWVGVKWWIGWGTGGSGALLLTECVGNQGTGVGICNQ